VAAKEKSINAIITNRNCEGIAMKVLGVRASAQEIRYAILEKDETGEIIFLNQSGEHRLKYPATAGTISEKLLWAKDEFDRILRQVQDIERIIIKTNEYGGTETSAKRETSFIDAICLLSAAEHNIEADRKLYSQIGATSSNAKEYAEQRIGKTEKYWNNTMADAILAALWEVRKG
jgi:hypothetical protein